MKTKIAVLFFGFLVMSCFSSKVLATDWSVSNSVQLSSAITNSVSGDTITVITSNIIMESTMPAVTNKAITISNGGGTQRVLNGNGVGSLIFDNSSATINGISFANMNRAINNTNASSLTIGNNVTFSSNKTETGYGGAICNQKGSSITIGSGAHFSSNTAYRAGAIYNNEAYMTIGNGAVFSGNRTNGNYGAIANDKNSTMIIGNAAQFLDNNGRQGGAILNNDGSTVIIGDNVELQNNSSSYESGAILNTKSSLMTIGNNALFKGNSAGYSYGAILNTENSTMTIKNDVKFISNTADYAVGAIANSKDSNLTIGDRALFSGNKGRDGAAIHNNSTSTAKIGDSAQFLNNVGAAVHNEKNSAMIIGNDAVFSSNTSIYAAGAIHNENSTLKIGKRAEFLYNQADYSGGVIYNHGTDNTGNDPVALLEIDVDAVFIGNTTKKSGGVIYNDNWGVSDRTDNHTIIGAGARFESNEAGDYGGVIYNAFGASMTIGKEAKFLLNKGTDGGVIYNERFVEMTVGDKAVFQSNEATTGDGGALYAFFASTTTIGDGAQFLSNKAAFDGGAIYIGSGTVYLTNPVFKDNQAGEKGGAVYMTGYAYTAGDYYYDNVGKLNISISTNIEASGNKMGTSGIDNVFYLERDSRLNLDIASGATLTLKDGVVAGDINTEITKTGAGLLALDSENNAIDGILNIFGGEVKAANSIGSGKIYFDNRASLHITGDMEMENEIYAKVGGSQDVNIELDEDVSLTMKGIMGNGREAFIKNGAGNMIFDGASSANLVKTDLTSGTLKINTENYSSRAVNVSSGTQLSGTGTIKGNVTNHGTVRPGDETAIAQLTINGNYTENGILGIRLYQDETSANDSLFVSGNAEINSINSKIDLDLTRGFQIGEMYTILTATSGLRGIYGGFANDLGIFDVEISSDSNNVYLELKRIITDYAGLSGLSHNQKEIASKIDNQGTNTENINKLSKIIGTATMLDEAGKKAVFDEVAGSIYANMLYASADNSGRRQVYNQIQEKINRDFNREEQTTCTHNFWGQVYGSHMERGSDENSVNKFEDNGTYLMLGWDNYCGSDSLILGYMVEFGKHTGKQGADEFSMNDYKGGVYLGTFGEKWNLKSALTVGYQQYEADREQKLLQSQTEAEYNGYSFGASADLYYKAYEAQEWKFSLSPFAGLEGNFVHTDKFTEKAKGNAASWLDVKANNFLIADAKLGVRAEKISKLSWYAELSGKCNFAGTKGTFEAKINGVGEDVEIYGTKNGVVSGKFEAGLDLKIGKNFDVFVVGVCEQGDKVGRYSGHLGVNYGW